MDTLLPVFMGLFPLAVMTLMILKFRIKIYLSVLVTLLLVLVVAGTYLGTPVETLTKSVAYGFIKGFWPIVLVIFAAIFAYNVMNKTGAIQTIQQSLSSVSDDRRIQIILIAWCFGGFLEGAAGFSVSVAIPLGILLALGFSPLKAAVATLMADTVPTAFGAVGIPMIMLSDITGMPATELSAMVILQLAVFNFLIPVGMVVVITGSLKKVKGVASLLLGVSIATTVPQYLTALYLGPQLVAFAGSLTSLAYLLIWVKLTKHETPTEHSSRSNVSVLQTQLPFGLLRAGMIYLLMFVLILAASPVSPVTQATLNSVMTPVAFTLVDGRTLTAKIDWIATPGVLILLATLVGGLFQKADFKTYVDAFTLTARQLARAGIAICGIVAMATVMDVSGLIAATAKPLIDLAGSHFAWFSPVLGILGTFITGSVVNANVLFAKLQLLASEHAGMDAVWLASANAAGAAIGKMIAPQSIAVAVTAVPMLSKETSKILSGTLSYCVAGALLLAVITAVFAGSL